MKMATKERKKDHLEIAVRERVECEERYFDEVLLVHNALPEVDFREIDTSTVFLGKRLKLPLMIAALTGGTKRAGEINRKLAAIAEEFGIGFGLGSQRIMLEDPRTRNTFYVRDVAPTTLVVGNIGITELKRRRSEEIREVLEAVECDAIAVHLNPAQEVFQRVGEGELDWRGCESALREFCRKIGFPVIAKEVGCGISKEVALRLRDCGVAAIDVGGKGGTNWIKIESVRSGRNAENFLGWGIPTPLAILEAKVAELPIVATGGVRTGLDVAKAIALGADIAGIALPFLRILEMEGEDGVRKYLQQLEFELRVAMFLVGAKKVSELKRAKFVLSERLLNWLRQREFDAAVLI